MAGGYPEAPGQRLAYDADGSRFFIISTLANVLDAAFDAGGAKQLLLNNESNNLGVVESGRLASGVKTARWLFTEPRDLFGVWAAGTTASYDGDVLYDFEWSSDCQTWTDGSWNATGVATFYGPPLALEGWREDIRPFSGPASWGLRHKVAASGGLAFYDKKLIQTHIYGATADAYTPNRLILLDKDTGLEIGLHDWGYLPRGTTKTKVCNVRNNASVQANDVSVGFTSLMNQDPHLYYSARDGGGGYASSLNLGNIAAATTYANDITVRIVSPSSAVMGPISSRVSLGQSGWT